MKYIPINNIMEKLLKTRRKLLFLVILIEWSILRLLVNNGVGKANDKNLTGALIITVGVMLLLLIISVHFWEKPWKQRESFWMSEMKL